MNPRPKPLSARIAELLPSREAFDIPLDPRALVWHLDFETFSEVEITSAGHWAYALHHSTEVLCLAHALGSDSPSLWRPPDALPQDLVYHVARGGLVGAHNAAFEFVIWNFAFRRQYPELPILKLEQLVCSSVLCSYYALPRKLLYAGQALELPVSKDEEGHRVMLKLSKPRRPSKKNPKTRWLPEDVPDDFEKLYHYCLTDTAVEQAIMEALPPIPAKERLFWMVDQCINARGFHIERKVANKFIEAVEYAGEAMNKELATLTNKTATTVNQRDKLLAWLETQKAGIQNLQRPHLEHMLPTLKGKAKTAIELRLEAGRSSTSKYRAMLAVASEIDDRVRGAFIFRSASTGRWGAELLQPHNLPRGLMELGEAWSAIEWLRTLDDPAAFHTFYPETFTTAASCIRGTVCASEGNELIVGDYSAIEACGVAWASGQDDLVADFANDEPVYENMAAEVSPTASRQVGKQLILGAGYGMSWSTFQTTCSKYGLEISDELAKRAIKVYREKYSKIKKGWARTEKAAINALKHPGQSFHALRCEWKRYNIRGKLFLTCKLPSGRFIFYPFPELVEQKTPWGSYKEMIVFKGVYHGQLVEESTYGGKLVENKIQAICAALLTEALARCELERPQRFPVILHVHDEGGTEVEEGKYDPKDFFDLLAEVPSWAKGFPVKVKGWRGKRYRKD